MSPDETRRYAMMLDSLFNGGLQDTLRNFIRALEELMRVRGPSSSGIAVLECVRGASRGYDRRYDEEDYEADRAREAREEARKRVLAYLGDPAELMTQEDEKKILDQLGVMIDEDRCSNACDRVRPGSVCSSQGSEERANRCAPKADRRHP